MLTATEFRARLDRLGLPRQEAADRLGLSLNGLFHQMRGDRPVSRQTEIILGHLEQEQARQDRQRRSRQRPVAAALALLVLVTLPWTALSSPAEWSPSRWCDRDLIAHLLEGMDQTNDLNAFDQFVVLSDALTAMGCLPPRPTAGCIRVGALWTCATPR